MSVQELTGEDEVRLHIEALVEERRQRYAKRKPVNGIAEEIDAAWQRLRELQAVQQHGPTDKILSRARVERELEKLMSE